MSEHETGAGQAETARAPQAEQAADAAQTPARRDAGSDERFLFIESWRWEAIGGFVSVLGVIAALFGIYEYYQRVEATRASETLALIDIWETRGARDAYGRLSGEVAAQFAAVPKADMDAAGRDERLASRVTGKVATRVLETGENAKAFEDVVYFFNRLGLCVEAKLCSGHTAEIFFDDTLTSFLNVFGGQIEERRKTTPRYGEATLDLAKGFAGR